MDYSDISLCIQARMSSSRLPGKVIVDIQGLPLIVFLYNRLKQKFPSLNITVLTSEESSDDPLVTILKENNIDYYRGSLNDVLSRFFHHQETLDTNINYIGRICADSPFLELDILKEVMDSKDSNYDIITTRYYDNEGVLKTTATKGNNFDLINRDSFKNIYKDNPILSKDDIEHVIFPFLRKKYKVVDVSNIVTQHQDVAIDTYEDLERLRSMI
jgi:spore coat polysaccharide biosynthesis protein SpsF